MDPCGLPLGGRRGLESGIKLLRFLEFLKRFFLLSFSLQSQTELVMRRRVTRQGMECRSKLGNRAFQITR